MQMGILAVLATAISLAMDAFSVSICIGIAQRGAKLRTALILGSAFGVFQFFMPLIGAEIAEHLSGFFNSWTPWIAAALIVWVAVKMIWETYKTGGSCPSLDVNTKNVIVLAFATSLDALAVGFSIESAGGSAFLLAGAAGVITFALSMAGGLGGGKMGEKMGQRAQYFGSGVLLCIAARIAYMAL
ncbi:manganese efflux pump [Synergistaceae bacterium OttesenSCG-928-D05]|nr:manganese efflux pump [Synergistaceae bacterium OttesenSCG-928-D05]